MLNNFSESKGLMIISLIPAASESSVISDLSKAVSAIIGVIIPFERIFFVVSKQKPVL